MEVYSLTEVLKFICKNTEKYGMMININQASNDLLTAVPWLSSDQHISLLVEGEGIVLFENQKEAEHTFQETKRPARCVTCNPDGELEYDNNEVWTK